MKETQRHELEKRSCRSETRDEKGQGCGSPEEAREEAKEEW
jgi:hypothetical protein